jgi:hypothetical protein
MNLSRNGIDSAPDGPPLLSMERQGSLLKATVVHPAVADLLWLLRDSLTQIHGCTALWLSVHGAKPAIELLWHRPARRPRSISGRRG